MLSGQSDGNACSSSSVREDNSAGDIAGDYHLEKITRTMSRLWSGPRLVRRLGSEVRVSTSFRIFALRMSLQSAGLPPGEGGLYGVICLHGIISSSSRMRRCFMFLLNGDWTVRSNCNAGRKELARRAGVWLGRSLYRTTTTSMMDAERGQISTRDSIGDNRRPTH